MAADPKPPTEAPPPGKVAKPTIKTLKATPREIRENKELRKKWLKATRDQAPSTKQQTMGYVNWAIIEELLGQPYDPTKIPYSKLYLMRRDGMLSFALHYIKVPLVRAEWYIKCEDARIAAAADANLRRIIGTYILQHTLSYDFGHIPIVKRMLSEFPDWTYLDPLADANEMEKPVWDEGRVPMLNYRTFVALRPEKTMPKFASDGSFKGMEYESAFDLAFPTIVDMDRPDVRKIPLENSLWVTNDKDSVFGSLYGYPLLAHSYIYWWTYGMAWALFNRHIEKDADPPAVVYHPDEELIDEESGDVTDYGERAVLLGDQARSGSTIALPNSAVEGLDGKATGLREWEISFLRGGDNTQTFFKTFEYLDVMKLRSLWIPEQALLEGKGGTSSRNVAEEMGDVFFESQAVRMAEIDDHINKYIIKPWVQANFPEFRGECIKVTRGFAKSDSALAKQLVQLVGQSQPDQLEIDTRAILEQAGIPMLSRAALAQRNQKIQEQLAAEAAATEPPATAPVPGQAAGVVQNPNAAANGGAAFSYIQPRGVIRLSEHAVPRTVHTEDPLIADVASAFYEQIRERYADQYASFADYLEGLSEVDLAEDGKLRARAERIVKRWRQPAGKINEAAKRVSNFLRAVVTRSGAVELDRHGLEASEDWSTTAQAWANERAAMAIPAWDETTRNELVQFVEAQLTKGFSAGEMAVNVREHFQQHPNWKAARIVRSEAKHGYNAGSLSAAEAAGVAIVQAVDGQGGSGGRTDDPCLHRNGRFFSVQDAWSEDDHPNGTLAWRWMPRSDLSIELVDIVPSEAPNAMAFFDGQSGTVYLKRGIPDRVAAQYLTAIGDRLVA